MPSIIKYRSWCKNCEDFTLHTHIDTTLSDLGYHYTCLCGKIHENIPYKEIPNEKILEQQQRYKKYRTNKSMLNISTMLSSIINTSLMNSSILEIDVIETDAGLEFKEQQEQKRLNAIKDSKKHELIKFNNVGRNDTCLCDSGKKYKKCCLIIHSSWNM